MNNLVEQYLVFAEGQAMHRIPMHMQEWMVKLDGFLTLNDRNILAHAGKISHEMALQYAHEEYDKIHRQQLQADAVQADAHDFDVLAKQLTEKNKKPDK